ncbi:MAG: alpha/beta hydrolase [Methylophaga sp.]|nr:alpha/beta hydrolase [Methylophaga sp.]
MSLMLNLIDNEKPNNPTIVMLHGLGGTHRYWNTGLENLSKYYHIVRPDLLGFGDSPQPWQIYTQEKHIKAIEQALASYPSFILVGHSLGAILALRFAQKHPDRVKALVLISLPLFVNKPNAYSWMRQTPSGWLMTNMAVAALTCMTTRRLAKKILPHFLDSYPPEVINDLVKHNIMSSISTLWKVIYNQAFLQDIHSLELDMSVYCIHAKNDSTAPYQTVHNLTTTLPKWTLSTLDNSGHHPWLWDNEKCIAVVNNAIKTVYSS